MLETIPTYRMILNSDSFLPDNNPGKNYVEMACELPNFQNIHRKQEMSFLPADKHEWYYRTQLLLEVKRFCREMLHNCAIGSEPYEHILRGTNWNDYTKLIADNRVQYFKYLVLNDLQQYGLYKRYLKEDIARSVTINDIKLHLRKYAVMLKLFELVNEDYQRLKSMYY